MYLRWADDRGFKTEVIEASPGEEYGIKSATFTVARRERLRDPQGRARQAPARPPEPVRPAHRRHTSFAQVIVAPLLEQAGAVEIDDDDLRIDTYRSSRRRRPAREQDRLGRPDHAPAERHRRRRPERAQPVREQGHRDEDPPLAARRESGGGARGRARARARRRQTWASAATRSAATSSTRTSSSRITAPSTRSGTPRACSTATSTGSSAPTCSRAQGTAV